MSGMPGPGDPETWGPPTGHPNDPRTADVDHSEECEEEDCGGECLEIPEPDYEAMMEREPDEAAAWAGVDPPW